MRKLEEKKKKRTEEVGIVETGLGHKGSQIIPVMVFMAKLNAACNATNIILTENKGCLPCCLKDY